MKILATLHLFTTTLLIFTESSPPFKNQPQTVYGPPQPSKIQNSPFRPFPQRQTLPDTYGPPSRETEQVSSNGWRIVQNTNSPQTIYGAPLTQPGNSWQAVPARQSSSPTWSNALQTSYETLPRLNSNRFNSPLTNYGAPQRQTLGPRRVPATWQSLNAQQNSYRSPDERPNVPSNIYGAPQRQTLDPRRVPATWQPLDNNAQQNSYRSPDERPNVPSNIYGAPQRQTLDPRRVPATWLPLNNNAQQNSYRSERPTSLPETQYGTPEINSVETLQRLRALTSIGSQSLPSREPGNLFNAQLRPQNLPQGLPEPRQQYLPTKDSSIDFRSSSNWNRNSQRDNNLDLPLPNLASSVEVQKLELKTLYPPLEDVRVQDGEKKESNGKNVNQGDYVPVSTTEVPVLKKPTGSTSRPVTTQRTDQDDQQDPAKETPNVAIATAVAGGVGTPGEQQFYLLQPDGRLQRVVYQKTRQEGDAADEYTVDYRFHNIQGDPNYVYAPLVTLG